MNIEILKNKDKTDKTRAAATAKLDAARKRRSMERKEKGEAPLYTDEMSEGIPNIDKIKSGFSKKLQQMEKDKAKRSRTSGGMRLPNRAPAEKVVKGNYDGTTAGTKNNRAPAEEGWETKFLQAAKKSQHASTEIIRNARMALAEKVLEALNPAAKQYLATRRAGHGSLKAYGNIPVNQNRQQARFLNPRGQGQGPTPAAPELDSEQLGKDVKGQPLKVRQAIAQKAMKNLKKDKDRYYRREGRIDRQDNYSDRPSGDQSQNASTEIIRNARMALAEKVLSELTRSEEYRLSQGGDTPDDIKAERAKRRKADPKAQRYAPRGEKKEKGVKMHSVIPPRHSRIGRAGAKIAARTQGEKDAIRRTYLARQQASTEILKKGRMALAEKVLSELSQGALERYRDKAMSQDPTTTPLKREKGISKASTKITRHKQGKSTPRSMFGGKSNQTSTTAGGGTLGTELAKTKPDTQQSMNRRGTSTKTKDSDKSKSKARAQKISNKFRASRGLVPLLPGEKHNPKRDKLGTTEN